MALQITEIRGMFCVFGELNSSNVNILDRHLRQFINPSNPVYLNLENVKSIDKSAAYMLQQMHSKAAMNNSVLAILGLGNEDILPVLHETKTSYILSDDRI